MVHRDIKPANIILTRQGRGILADFGIVQIVGATRHTVSGALIGTLNYMAPEQGLKGQTDARSDLYSIGVVFYELLTGRPPFDADTPLAILMKHVNDPLPRPSAINPSIPPSFERVLLKDLSKEPEDRYQNAAELMQAIQQAALESGIVLPEKITDPFPTSRPDSLNEPISVYSGSNRPSEKEAHFAKEDTINMTNPVAPTIPPASQPASHFDSPRPKNTDRILKGVFLLPIWNICLVIICGFLNRWDVFSLAWPIEILLVALMLSRIMEAVGALGIVIPVYILTTVGGLLAYYSILGAWTQWYLWLLIPLVVFGVIRYMVTKHHELSSQDRYFHSVNIGKDMGKINMMLIIITTVLAFLNPFSS
jgi:hypothetical protein